MLRLVDRFGNTATSVSSGSISVSVSNTTTGSSVIAGASANLSSGVASFSGLAIKGLAKNYVLVYSYTSGSDTFTRTQLLTLQAGNPHSIDVTTSPTTSQAGEVLSSQPIVKIYDVDGNYVDWAGTEVSVTASVTNGVAGTLELIKSDYSSASSADVTRTALGGQVAFDGLRMKGQVGVDYTLSFAATFNDGVSTTALIGDSSSSFS